MKYVPKRLFSCWLGLNVQCEPCPDVQRELLAVVPSRWNMYLVQLCWGWPALIVLCESYTECIVWLLAAVQLSEISYALSNLSQCSLVLNYCVLVAVTIQWSMCLVLQNCPQFTNVLNVTFLFNEVCAWYHCPSAKLSLMYPVTAVLNVQCDLLQLFQFDDSPEDDLSLMYCETRTLTVLCWLLY
jgi:hypothetical protein